ncbi:hypothetical protein V8C42DRAFT_327749 [Trichoderma barbatum]
MRSFSVLSLLCGAATVVQGAISSIAVPSVIGYNDRAINITISSTADPAPTYSYPLSLLFGFDSTDGAGVSPVEFGKDLGLVDLARNGGVGGVLSLPVGGSDRSWTKGQFKLFISSLIYPTAKLSVQIWIAEVSYGATGSTTTTQAKLAGNMVYASTK